MACDGDLCDSWFVVRRSLRGIRAGDASRGGEGLLKPYIQYTWAL